MGTTRVTHLRRVGQHRRHRRLRPPRLRHNHPINRNRNLSNSFQHLTIASPMIEMATRGNPMTVNRLTTAKHTTENRRMIGIHTIASLTTGNPTTGHTIELHTTALFWASQRPAL